MRVGLVPMSAKPYHRGHHYLVTTAAQQNDKVLLFVSVSDRRRKGELPIFGSDMQKIWKEQLEPILPQNVEVSYGGSPIRKVFDVLIAEEQKLISGLSVDNIYTLYSDNEDTELNYTVGRPNRLGVLPDRSPADKYFPELLRAGYVKFAAIETPKLFTRGTGAPNVSGTEMRNRLSDDSRREEFLQDLPDDLTDDARNTIYNTLRPSINENTSAGIFEYFVRNSKKRPEKGTQDYTDYLENMMAELQHIKSSYESRKKSGARYRKEASKLQDAYSELRRLRNKNNKLLMSKQNISEVYWAHRAGYNVSVSNDEAEKLSNEEIRNFLTKYIKC